MVGSGVGWEKKLSGKDMRKWKMPGKKQISRRKKSPSVVVSEAWAGFGPGPGLGMMEYVSFEAGLLALSLELGRAVVASGTSSATLRGMNLCLHIMQAGRGFTLC